MIRAIERHEKPRKVRRNGFAPGIIYGEGIEGPVPVKFEMTRLKRILRKHTGNARLRIKLQEQIVQCVIKEVQRHPVTGEIMHIDLQKVNENKPVRLKLPLKFNGRKKLDEKKLLLHVFISEIEVTGAINLLPQYIQVDISDKKPGDKITVKDIRLDSSVRISSTEDEILAQVILAKELEVAS